MAISAGIQSPSFWKLISLHRIQGLECLMWSSNFLLLREKFCVFDILPQFRLSCLGPRVSFGFFWWELVTVIATLLNADPFVSYCGGFHLVFRAFSEGVTPYTPQHGHCCVLGGDEVWILLCCHLEPSLQIPSFITHKFYLPQTLYHEHSSVNFFATLWKRIAFL